MRCSVVDVSSCLLRQRMLHLDSRKRGVVPVGLSGRFQHLPGLRSREPPDIILAVILFSVTDCDLARACHCFACNHQLRAGSTERPRLARNQLNVTHLNTRFLNGLAAYSFFDGFTAVYESGKACPHPRTQSLRVAQ